MSDSDDSFDGPVILSKQGGATVTLVGPGAVIKKGNRVRRSEGAAMELVKQYTDIPVPILYGADFYIKNGEEWGSLLMEFVEGTVLDSLWDKYNVSAKRSTCQAVWEIVAQLRQIPRPPELSHLFHCGADGSPSVDVLLQDLQTPARDIIDDDMLRARIYERYLYFNGRLYEDTLPGMLPHSDTSVFTHGDLAPRNILVDPDNGCITGIIDWEASGWFPDYWEYANMMKPSADKDWQAWMEVTKPEDWDIVGIVKSRKVLF